MKDIEEVVDDQGSEWLQVKKKQRNKSKYYLRKPVPQYKEKQTSEVISRQPAMIDRSSLPRKHKSHHRNAVTKAVTNYTSVKTKDEIYEDKLVVNQAEECSKLPFLGAEGSNVDSSEMPYFSCKAGSFEVNFNDTDEFASNDCKYNRILKKGDSPSNYMVGFGNLELSNDPIFSNESDKNAEVSSVLSGVGDLKISASPASNEDSNVASISKESDVLPSGKSGPKTSGLSTTEDFVGSGHMQHNPILDDSSKTQIVSDSVEASANDNKGRFREHLWCFLFENLNRSIDELYLLCELECDLEQMKEVILVLEEAASDFKDLSCRVEEFENMKVSSSGQIEEISMTLKTDHPRPHALSWEVRRMTTSPHRAEILSSSLEAFKKIQLERESMRLAKDSETMGPDCPKICDNTSSHIVKKLSRTRVAISNSKDLMNKSGNSNCKSDTVSKNIIEENGTCESSNCIKMKNLSTFDSSSSMSAFKVSSDSITVKIKKHTSETEHVVPNKGETALTESKDAKDSTAMDPGMRQNLVSVEDKEMKHATSRKSMNAWKEKRDWGDILSSRVSYSSAMNKRSSERVRILHDKLMSPEKKKKTALHLKKEAEEKHAKAMRIRRELENERVQKLQRTSEKLNRINDRQAFRSLKLREGMYARHQRSESRHEAFLAQVSRRAGDESSKVNEVRFITNLNEENKKLMLRQKYRDSELRRAEKLQVIKTKQKEDMAREEAVLERRKLIEAEKLQRLAEIQRKKDEAQVRWEEERKAASAAREAKAIEQVRRKQARAKAQQEEALLLAQKLAERLSESEQRRKFYLEQIKEKASMDCRDQSSPLFWHSLSKDNQGRSGLSSNGEDHQLSNLGNSTLANGNASAQHPLKRRIKRIRQRLMALKHEYSESSGVSENGGIGYRTALGIARAKIGKWLLELQRLRQARKEGAASIGLITSEIAKFVEGKELELHASRDSGLLDFIASTLPASHASKPEACQVTIHLLRLLRVVLLVPANRSYFLAQNLLPPIIPMLSGALENYIKIAASLHGSTTTNVLLPNKSSPNFESIAEVLDGFLWTVTTIIGHITYNENQLQMQGNLLELVVLYQIIHRLRELFALYDRPQVEGSPFPSSILLSIKLLAVLTSRPGSALSIDWESSPIKMGRDSHIEETKASEFTEFDMDDRAAPVENALINTDDVIVAPMEAKKDESGVKVIGAATKHDNALLNQPMALLLSVISETGLVCLPSLLTAVLLRANSRSSSEQIPLNFEEVATGVLKVLNNLAVVDITLVQRMLARPDLKMEFFHLVSFLLSHCTAKWTRISDQVGSLLVECLSLLGYFALFHPGNQAVLRWGKTPTILHKVCDLPFALFSDPQLMPVVGGALIAACYGCDQNKGVIQQEISIDMLLSLLNSFPPPTESKKIATNPRPAKGKMIQHSHSESGLISSFPRAFLLKARHFFIANATPA